MNGTNLDARRTRHEEVSETRVICASYHGVHVGLEREDHIAGGPQSPQKGHVIPKGRHETRAEDPGNRHAAKLGL